ncbi:MAG: hypothetical protein HRT90_06775 [Candidatus Margulisbacteria bacterium]|nr:hypothetical protein [Candidatus Margulisiibacteriota bacterium]
MRGLIAIFSFAILVSACGSGTAETKETVGTEVEASAEENAGSFAEDTKTIESTCLAMLDAFSTKKGTPPDWARLNNLCAESAQFNSVTHYEEAEMHQHTLKSYEEDEGEWYDNNDVMEIQLGLTVDRFHNVANAFQAYQLDYDNHDGEAGSEKGVLFYQLAFVGDRWYVTNLMWQSESEGIEVGEELIN